MWKQTVSASHPSITGPQVLQQLGRGNHVLRKKKIVWSSGATSLNSSSLINSTQVTIALLNRVRTEWENGSRFLVKDLEKPPFFSLMLIPTGGSPSSFLGLDSNIYNPKSKALVSLWKARRETCCFLRVSPPAVLRPAGPTDDAPKPRYPAKRGYRNPSRTEPAPGSTGGGERPRRETESPVTRRSGLPATLSRGRARQTKMLVEEMGLFCSPPLLTGSAGPGLPPSPPEAPAAPGARRRSRGSPRTGGLGSAQPLRSEPGCGGPGTARAERASPPSGPYRAAGQAPPRRQDSRPSGPGPAPAPPAAASTSVVAGEGAGWGRGGAAASRGGLGPAVPPRPQEAAKAPQIGEPRSPPPAPAPTRRAAPAPSAAASRFSRRPLRLLHKSVRGPQCTAREARSFPGNRGRRFETRAAERPFPSPTSDTPSAHGCPPERRAASAPQQSPRGRGVPAEGCSHRRDACQSHPASAVLPGACVSRHGPAGQVYPLLPAAAAGPCPHPPARRRHLRLPHLRPAPPVSARRPRPRPRSTLRDTQGCCAGFPALRLALRWGEGLTRCNSLCGE